MTCNCLPTHIAYLSHTGGVHKSSLCIPLQIVVSVQHTPHRGCQSSHSLLMCRSNAPSLLNRARRACSPPYQQQSRRVLCTQDATGTPLVCGSRPLPCCLGDQPLCSNHICRASLIQGCRHFVHASSTDSCRQSERHLPPPVRISGSRAAAGHDVRKRRSVARTLSTMPE